MNSPDSRASSLHLILGPPAAGKTTFARSLAGRLPAALVDIDLSTEPVVRAALSALGMDPNDRDSPEYKRIFRSPIYDSLFTIAAANLPHIDVVLTGPFTSEMRDPNWLEALRDQWFPPPYQIKPYYLSCPSELLFERMKKRANPRDAAKLADWETYRKYYGPPLPPAFPHELVVTG